MQIKFATYNIHKGVGLDRRCDPERIMAVLHEIGADVVALQEADRRFGQREAILSKALINEHHWQAAPIASRRDSLGWHGNALLVKPGIEIVECARIAIPTIEPRGAISARLRKEGVEFVAVGMHLDLSGLARKRQVREVCATVGGDKTACVLMGDLNEWSREAGAFREFGEDWCVMAPGRSFPSRRPVAMLDRIVHSPHWSALETGVHHSALSARASDHLPAWARLEL